MNANQVVHGENKHYIIVKSYYLAATFSMTSLRGIVSYSIYIYNLGGSTFQPAKLGME